MELNSTAEEQVLLEKLRQRRAELRESMSALENALAAPTVGAPERWADRVHTALVELSADFRLHVEITEGSNGLYQELLETAPRLSEAVSRLTGEHAAIRHTLDALLSTAATSTDADRLRDQGTALLGRLVRHRQQGSDLVYEAYEFDIGGDT
jgi:hypothetical protein